MGAIKKAFSPKSSMIAKREGVWIEVIDALNECTSLEELSDFGKWVKLTHWNMPYPYRAPLADEIEAHAQKIIADEEILRRWGE